MFMYVGVCVGVGIHHISTMVKNGRGEIISGILFLNNSSYVVHFCSVC